MAATKAKERRIGLAVSEEVAEVAEASAADNQTSEEVSGEKTRTNAQAARASAGTIAEVTRINTVTINVDAMKQPG